MFDPSSIFSRPSGPRHDRIPPTFAARQALRQAVRQVMAGSPARPPLDWTELRRIASRAVALTGLDPRCEDFAMVLANNHSWTDEVAAVPYNRRLLVLPACLGTRDSCDWPGQHGETDCGCALPGIQREARRLGYQVVTAAHPYKLLSLALARRVEAVIGVSCLSVLESVFPVMQATGIPALAIPLLQDHCTHAAVDLEWVWESIELTRADLSRGLDLDDLRADVGRWFTAAALAEVLREPASQAEEVSQEWLARDGKRWRPFLVRCAWEACRGDAAGAVTGLRRLAVAVECFHKASLVHDDIEDDDAVRYGEPTLHVQHGVPIAINAGDLILGYGYRLIAESGAPADRLAAMLRVASDGHVTLSLGQGAELAWMRDPRPLGLDQVLAIFRQKTAPAFEVALKLGALHAGADARTLDILGRYSEALGIAYQIRDDLEDFSGESDSDDTADLRPSLLLALAYERANGEARELLDGVWRRRVPLAEVTPRLRQIYHDHGLVAEARRLLDVYRRRAGQALAELDNPTLRGLLRRVQARIFADAVPAPALPLPAPAPVAVA